jgi:hypothetical protein
MMSPAHVQTIRKKKPLLFLADAGESPDRFGW